MLCCARCEDEITLTGYEGGNVVINCPYQKGYAFYPKYLKKADGVTIIIISGGHIEGTQNGRVSLQDKRDSNTFTVTIRKLTLEDAGRYVCVAGTWGTDQHTTVNLNIGRLVYFTWQTHVILLLLDALPDRDCYRTRTLV